MGQGVVDQQGDGAEGLEPGEDEDADAVGQPGGGPGGALEEVVEGIQAVAAGVVVQGARVGTLGDAEEGMLAQAHDPGEQQFAAGRAGGVSKGRGEFLDDRVERKYHGPHGGTSVPWGLYHPQGYEEPPPSSAPQARGELSTCPGKPAKVQRRLF